MTKQNCPVCRRANLATATNCWICGASLKDQLASVPPSDGSIYAESIVTPQEQAMETEQRQTSWLGIVLSTIGGVFAVVTASVIIAVGAFCFLVISLVYSIIAMLDNICSNCTPP